MDDFGSFVSHYFRFRFHRDGDVVVAECTQSKLSEEENIESVGHELLTLIEKYGCRQLIVDLNQVLYVTSSMLGKLIRAHRQMHRVNGEMVLIGLTPTVLETLDTSRLIDYFNVAKNDEEALEFFDQMEREPDESSEPADSE
ncbi:STAS domain-containing protein [Thalassoroseus pseudoceratinae]|uniref:STAS domain-containing protein n=1 Tax=Thalassoroseus pseudoceratinae TaxID=2713176 RepID=UPI00141EDC92|nr:STAS domain-containing protein [Thalassoroseus pseudoceratinae]